MRPASVLGIVVAAIAAACAAPESPEAVRGGPTAAHAGPGVARATEHGVVVTVEAWPTNPASPHPDVLALEVTIENQGAVPLRVATGQLALTAPVPQTALDVPGGLRGGNVIDRPIPPPIPPRILDAPAPPGAERPANEVWPSPLSTNDRVTPTAPTTWERAPLPEAIVPPGAAVRGFVFFGDVRPVFERYDLRVELVDATTNEGFGMVRVPLLEPAG